MSTDRIKVAVPVAEVKGWNPDVIQEMNKMYRKKPTTIPSFQYKWKYKVVLVDVCVPKTLFGNSLEEAGPQDLFKLVQRLQEEAQKQYGIWISQDSLLHADVWYLEYKKNILLPLKYCLANLLDKIALCLARRHQDLTKVKYFSREGNKGYKVGLHTDGYEICFYDKTTRSLFKGTGDDKKVFRKLLEQDLQVLNYEVKMFKKTVITNQLKPYKSLYNFTLQDVWDQVLSQQVLWSHWNNIEKTIPTVRLSTSQLQKSIHQAVLNGISINDIACKLFWDLLESELGSTRLKKLLVPAVCKVGSKRRENQYVSLKNKSRKLKPLFKTRKEYIVQRIGQYLQEFKPIRIEAETGNIQGVL